MYKLTKYNSIIRLEDGSCIPKDEVNSDYTDYLNWLSSGNTPEPIDPPIIVIPQLVTMKQARMCFIIRDLFDQVDSAISALTGKDGKLARVQWEYSTTVDRDSLLVIQITTQLGFTSAQLDELFTFAATL